MEYQKILNLLNEESDCTFVAIKWNKCKRKLCVGNEIIYNPKVLKPNLCDDDDAYILVRGDITIIGHDATQIALKLCTIHKVHHKN